MVGANGSFEIHQLCKHPREARGERWPPNTLKQPHSANQFVQKHCAVQIAMQIFCTANRSDETDRKKVLKMSSFFSRLG